MYAIAKEILYNRHTTAEPDDFLQWLQLDLSNFMVLSVFAGYIVSSALGSTRYQLQKPYQLISENGSRIAVTAASYLQSHDAEHPDHILFPIDYSHCDIIIFCLLKATTQKVSPLQTDLWDFYMLPASALPSKKPKEITLSTLIKSDPIRSNYVILRNDLRKLEQLER